MDFNSFTGALVLALLGSLLGRRSYDTTQASTLINWRSVSVKGCFARVGKSWFLGGSLKHTQAPAFCLFRSTQIRKLVARACTACKKLSVLTSYAAELRFLPLDRGSE
jgi:hypothetical protein